MLVPYGGNFAARFCLFLSAVVATAALAPVCRGDVITLKDGYAIEGKIGRLTQIAANPLAPAADGPQMIVLVDDELRRVFVPFLQVKSDAPPADNIPRQARIPVKQREASGGSVITSVGVLVNVTPFDEYGRRTVSMRTADGVIHVIQGMTMVTPKFIQLKGLYAEKMYKWDTKIPTSSIPAPLLSKILRREAGDSVDGRQLIIQMYIESERYGDAKAELEQFAKDFPSIDVKKLNEGLQVAHAQRMVKEIEFRRDAGQHLLALAMCEKFPVNGPQVARQRVIEIQEEYQRMHEQGKRVLELFTQHMEALTDDRQKEGLKPIQEEITKELSAYNLERLADYDRLADDKKTTPEEKLSLAISGWYLGRGEATENLSVAIAVHTVRNLLRQYLTSTHEAERSEILSRLDKYEGTSPTYVAKVLAHMKPPIETDLQDGMPPGMFEISVPGISGEPDVEYFVQLPPEYSPYRRYPTIVTLNSAATTPENQISWWAGDFNEPKTMRMGQAARRGYIVIAPKWTEARQVKYNFSAQEHAAVLFSLRDAVQRFSIDTDKVYISGHSMGGDAAWDIALAHPDLWAGVMPIGASSDKYITKYVDNGKCVPLYYVAGEMDGDRFAKCAPILDIYLKYVGYNAVVVQYQGRGHEHFYDEVQNLFGWMEHQTRNPLPKDFKVVSMRPWDNFFYWIEVEEIPSTFVTLPAAYPAKGPLKNASIEAKMNSETSLSVRSSSGCKTTVYLTPQMVNFEGKFTITYNGSAKRFGTQPNLGVLLEDARTRGDRQHPFWQKVELGK